MTGDAPEFAQDSVLLKINTVTNLFLKLQDKRNEKKNNLEKINSTTIQTQNYKLKFQYAVHN